jgi:hypothetical protein
VEVIRSVPDDEFQDLPARLEQEYADKFRALGAGFNAWANSAKIGAEVVFGSGSGPIWPVSARYARRPGPFSLVGPLVPYRTLRDAERELRTEIDNVLIRVKKGERPRAFRWRR